MKSGQEYYFISAGEYSGDLLGADFVREMRHLDPSLIPIGVVGDNMRRTDVREFGSIDDFAVMGIWDVAKKLAPMRQRIAYLLSRIDALKPRFAVLIDAPGLHFLVAEQLRLRGVPVFQYVAPKLWAWGEKRVTALKRDFRMILGILPFEEKFFLDRGVNYRYVGSPHIDRVSKIIIDRENIRIGKTDRVVAVLPGSRVSELKLILPRLLQIKERIETLRPGVKFVMPLAHSLALDDLRRVLPRPNNLKVLSEFELSYEQIRIFRGMSLELMSIADVAAVASGTATLECALLGTPMVVVYVMNDSSYEIAKSIVKVPYASLVNLICGESVVPEFIQNFRTNDVANEILRLLDDDAERARVQGYFSRLRNSMHGGAAAVAARVVYENYVGRPEFFGGTGVGT